LPGLPEQGLEIKMKRHEVPALFLSLASPLKGSPKAISLFPPSPAEALLPVAIGYRATNNPGCMYRQKDKPHPIKRV
jgi:hypothetical protein